MKQLSGIYMLCWGDENDYFYFGQSSNLWNRRGQHFRHLKKGTHENKKLQNLYNKYGLPQFQFMEICPISQLNKAEAKFLRGWFGYKYCCNLTPLTFSVSGYKLSDEIKRKISLLRTGHKLSQEHKKNISIGLLRAYKNGGKKAKPLLGKLNPFFGKKHSQDTINKMRGKSKGIGAANVTAKLTLNLETGIFYDYAGEAAETININPQYLRRYLNGDRPNKTSFIYV